MTEVRLRGRGQGACGFEFFEDRAVGRCTLATDRVNAHLADLRASTEQHAL
jgi:hypothetical protein